MNDHAYQPLTRRPIAARFRSTGTAPAELCVRLGIHADAVSYASVVAAALAALCYWRSGVTPTLLLIAPLLTYLRLWLNMLDGMVAIASRTASRRGEVINELPDRVSDLLILVGVAHSGLCTPMLGYWATIAALLTAYVGLLGAGVGASRQFAGVMSKPWRMVALHVGAWTTLAMLARGHGLVDAAGLSPLDWALIVILVGCVQTIWVRLSRILHAVRESGARDRRRR